LTQVLNLEEATMTTTTLASRHHGKWQARCAADDRTRQTGTVHVVYLDSLGFIVVPDGAMHRDDVTEVYRSPLSA
jgi:hypothetical protein